MVEFRRPFLSSLEMLRQIEKLYDELSSRSQTAKELAIGLTKIPLNFQPGTAYEYGVSYDVVGYLIEVIDGLGPEASGGFFDWRGQPVPW